ncbi:MAG: hypothetical protein J5687_09995 [Treponema sp.]|nr:hypothetical protein [Treponema sp.]
MYNISVCKGCGRTLNKDYLYCPWCGVSRVSDANDKESLEMMLNHYEEDRKDVRRKQLYEMERELEDLEQELSVLVLSAEMHK